jgi:hypothetical protein
MVASPSLLAETDTGSRAARADVLGDIDGDDDVGLSDLGLLLADGGQERPYTWRMSCAGKLEV